MFSGFCWSMSAPVSESMVVCASQVMVASSEFGLLGRSILPGCQCNLFILTEYGPRSELQQASKIGFWVEKQCPRSAFLWKRGAKLAFVDEKIGTMRETLGGIGILMAPCRQEAVLDT